MDCIVCGHPLKFISERRNRKTYEIEETQLLCKRCGHYVVIKKDGSQTWYDKNDRPIHPTHDR